MEQVLERIGRLCAALVDPGLGAPAGAAVAVKGAVRTDEYSLEEFLTSVDELTDDDRAQLVEAALLMIQDVYVHLPLKRAMHAVDPLQRLKVLKNRLDTITPGGFHHEMIAIFHSLRDLHTNYILPESYQSKAAYLPFLVEEYFESGDPSEPRYVVAKVRPGALPPEFRPGVVVTHWGGVPIRRAIEINAEREAGSNADAVHARGLEALTLRPMGVTAPPDETWVNVGFEVDGRPHEIRVNWRVIEPPPSASGIGLAGVGAAPELSHVFGVDVRTENVRRAKKALFSPEAMEAEEQMTVRAIHSLRREASGREAGPADIVVSPASATGPGHRPKTTDQVSLVMGLDDRAESARRARKTLFFPQAMQQEQIVAAGARLAPDAADAPDPVVVSLMPDVFAFRRIPGRGGELGYIRIFTFMVRDADAFVAEFVRIAGLLLQTGLIIDMRGNGGGNILAAEKLLQVLTPHPIEPERFHFINTPTTHDLCREAPEEFNLKPWDSAIGLAIQTGKTYSQGFSLEPAERYNTIGRRYQGPVVLVIDALCYSATDIFTAGFQDYGIGQILGVHRHTGAGGANVWEHRMLERILPKQFLPLPKGATFRVSVRRSTRVKERAGVPVEDLGVSPHEVHPMTRKDVLENNVDLIAHAAEILAPQKVRALSGRFDRSRQPAPGIEVSAENVTRVDAYHGERPLGSAEVRDGRATLILPPGPTPDGTIRLRSYDGERLVAVAPVAT
jgi:hypothetical protein